MAYEITVPFKRPILVIACQHPAAEGQEAKGEIMDLVDKSVHSGHWYFNFRCPGCQREITLEAKAHD